MNRPNDDGFYIGYGINFDVERYSKDKKSIADQIGYTVLEQLQSAFKLNGLPSTIPEKWIKTQLFTAGFCIVKEVDGKLYSFTGGLGGEPDPYYQPTIATIANPALGFSGEYKIGEECVVISNDVYRRGIIPLIGKYAGLLTETAITMRIALINARSTAILSGSDESTIESINEYLRQMEEGNLGVIQENAFLDDLKVNPTATSNSEKLTDLIEVNQYLKASLYNIIGLQSNYNMKREAINSSEAELGDDMLKPLIDQMYDCWSDGFEKVNSMYGTNIAVEYDSSWKKNEAKQEEEIEEAEKPEENEEAKDGNQDESDNSEGVSDSGDFDEPENKEES